MSCIPQEKIDILIKEGFSEDELAGFARHFSFFDADKSGYIERKEVGHVLRAVGANPTHAEVKRFMQEVDQSGDGRIDFCEFVRRFKESTSIKSRDEFKQCLLQAFKTLDVDNSGYLDRNEIRRYLTGVGNEKVSQAEADAFLDELDQDNNGKINIEEFVSITTMSTEELKDHMQKKKGKKSSRSPSAASQRSTGEKPASPKASSEKARTPTPASSAAEEEQPTEEKVASRASSKPASARSQASRTSSKHDSDREKTPQPEEPEEARTPTPDHDKDEEKKDEEERPASKAASKTSEAEDRPASHASSKKSEKAGSGDEGDKGDNTERAASKASSHKSGSRPASKAESKKSSAHEGSRTGSRASKTGSAAAKESSEDAHAEAGGDGDKTPSRAASKAEE